VKGLFFRKRNIIAAVLAMLIAFAGCFVVKIQAAGQVDTDKAVTITGQIGAGDTSVFATRYNGIVKVDLYKIADLDKAGNATLTDEFANSQIDLSVLNKDKVTVEDVTEQIVAPAEAALNGKTAIKTIDVAVANQTGTGSVTIDKGAGIYLYVPQSVQDDRYIYDFTSYVIYAPSSVYISSADENGQALKTGSDEWQYDVSFNLKSTANQRYGYLDIVKTLDTFNASLGTASFVFDVEAELDGNNVFSNVYTITFDGAGTKTITVAGENNKAIIPAGATVTVTEVYSGASYTQQVTAAALDGSDTKVLQADIIADQTATVGFENDYDNRLEVGSIAVENKFVKDSTATSGYIFSGNNISEGGAE